jgi:RHS repeat-associated protein
MRTSNYTFLKQENNLYSKPVKGLQGFRVCYRFAFNGQEKDDEVFIGAYTAEYWEYDSRLGRRWNIDPITYPWQSSYAVFNNNPILFVDPTGAVAERVPIKKGDVVGTDSKGRPIKASSDEVLVTPKPSASTTPINKLAYNENDLKVPNPVSDCVPGEGKAMVNGTIGAANSLIVFFKDPISNTFLAGYDICLSINKKYNYLSNSSLSQIEADALTYLTSNRTSAGREEELNRLEDGYKTVVLSVVTEATLSYTYNQLFVSDINQLMRNPVSIEGKSLDKIQKILKTPDGWESGGMRKTRGLNKGWTLRELNPSGTDFTDRFLQYHPGTLRHFGGKPYWKVSSGKKGVKHYAAF